MRVPLLIRAPGLGAQVDDRLAQHVDIAPTVLALLGLPQHPSFQGINLLATPHDPDRSVYMVAQTPDAYQYGIIRSGYKLIYDERQRQHLLFDLRNDPAEKHDLAEFQPDLTKNLMTRLNTWRKLQIDYYADSGLHTREYPPVLRDETD
jgi:arylsulfatase A-like enzyme